jgi:NADPH:quinone reductase-like Zn-dependent oxidoreductase
MSVPSMKALGLHGPRDLRLDDAPKPSASPGSVVVRVQAAPLWDYLVC